MMSKLFANCFSVCPGAGASKGPRLRDLCWTGFSWFFLGRALMGQEALDKMASLLNTKHKSSDHFD